MAFDDLEPFGYDMLNFRAGLIASVVAGTKGGDPISPMRWFGDDEAKKPETPEQIAANIRTKVFGMKG